MEREKKQKPMNLSDKRTAGGGVGGYQRRVVVLQNTFYSPAVHIKDTRNSNFNNLVIAVRYV